MNNNPNKIGENLYYLYQNIWLIAILILSFLVYEKLRNSYDDDRRKLAEILAPICVIVLLCFIIIGSSNLIKLVEGFSNDAISTPSIQSSIADSSVNYYKTTDVSGLQAKYGIYGTCSDAARIALETSNTDSIYKCSVKKQLGEQNCYLNGYYIDNQVMSDLGSMSNEICNREAAKYSSKNYVGTTTQTIPSTKPTVSLDNTWNPDVYPVLSLEEPNNEYPAYNPSNFESDVSSTTQMDKASWCHAYYPGSIYYASSNTCFYTQYWEDGNGGWYGQSDYIHIPF